MRIQCLQPLITLRGASSVTTIVQPESGWLDLGMFRDIVAWLDVREVTSTGGGSVVLNYQSSPTKEDPATGSLFATMASVTISSAAGVTVTPMLADVITNPLARWLRWQLVATSQTAMWDATFRICIAGSAQGQRATFGPKTRPRSAIASNVRSARKDVSMFRGDCRGCHECAS